MPSLYEQLMNSKGAPRASGAPNSTQLHKAPMNLRSAMQRYAEGGDISNVDEFEVSSIPAVPDYNRALGGGESVNNMQNQFLGMGMDEDTIDSVISKYYMPEQSVQPTEPLVQPDLQMDYGTDRQTGFTGSPPVPTPSNNVLTGNILAGASWHSTNPTLADELTQYTGESTLNTAVGGATTADTLKQLNDFISSGGSFAPGSNVFLQQGGLDFISGVDKNTTESNLDQIISTLENQGANVILSGAPYAASMNDVQSNNFDSALDPIYANLAGKHKNVSLVSSMGDILKDKSLLSDPIHPNQKGWEAYNKSILDLLKSLKNKSS
jgi:lysophospholipase L1-like esterase